ncbi:hypothetical protein KFE25_006602 [Diacronema lutheri]|uniref:Uncharacterized protein n=1 Tax=Diacronema lutheri TaxID=2081491 RepID=A0A8J5X697_DIALT|nr:hypothetical protein KFE25_006602 [Diacronema lutheri]
MAPLVGKRVRLVDVGSKPELNGREGVALSFNEASCRYNVRLDHTDAVLSLKPACLVALPSGGADDGAAGARGGARARGLPPALEELLRRLGGGLPTLPMGLTPARLGLGVLAACVVLPRVLSARLALGALAAALAVRAYGVGGVRARARYWVGKVASAVSRVTGTPVSELQAAILVAVAMLMAWRYVLSGVLAGAPPAALAAGARAQQGFEAYTKGYNDGRFNRSFAPIADVAEGGSGAAAGGGGGWGLSSLLKLAMAGGMIHQMGAPAGAPWSASNLMASARHMSPMNAIFFVQMLSSLF